MIAPQRKQTGLSLVELMIAIALSLILTLGIIQIFSSSKQTSRVQNALARLQENARFALDILSHDIRMAGQLGCNSNAFTVDSSNNQLGAFGSGIFGYDYGAGSESINLTTNGGSLNNVIEGTDVIVVISAAPNAVPISSATLDGVTVDVLGSLADIAEGDPVVVSDCDTADLFIAGDRGTNSRTIPSTVELSKIYSDNAEVAALNYAAYYLRESNGRPSLWRSFVNGTAGGATSVSSEQLLEGVEDFQILYGVDINGDGSSISYVSADDLPDDPSTPVPDTSRVISVRIHLLLSTDEDNLTVSNTPQTYWFPDPDTNTLAEQQVDANDRRLYRSFTTTLRLRNHGIGT